MKSKITVKADKKLSLDLITQYIYGHMCWLSPEKAIKFVFLMLYAYC